jgi:integrase/recombinase XerD
VCAAPQRGNTPHAEDTFSGSTEEPAPRRLRRRHPARWDGHGPSRACGFRAGAAEDDDQRILRLTSVADEQEEAAVRRGDRHRLRHGDAQPVLRRLPGRHGQTGTNTKQRNLRHLLTWLEGAYGHPHPYTDQLNRYAPLKVRPSTLSLQFVADLLEVTGNGQARCFADARDHALIRFPCEGVRRTEAVELSVTDLPPDLIAQPFVRVTPIKGARVHEEGRLVPLSAATARAMIVYLRFWRRHKYAESPQLWLGLRNHGPMNGWGLYRMLQRRAAQAGYDPDVHPHQFRHTFANDWLDKGGSEGDLMRLMGWSSRSMLDRYGADMAERRAIDAKRRMGEMY